MLGSSWGTGLVATIVFVFDARRKEGELRCVGKTEIKYLRTKNGKRNTKTKHEEQHQNTQHKKTKNDKKLTVSKTPFGVAGFASVAQWGRSGYFRLLRFVLGLETVSFWLLSVMSSLALFVSLRCHLLGVVAFFLISAHLPYELSVRHALPLVVPFLTNLSLIHI